MSIHLLKWNYSVQEEKHGTKDSYNESSTKERLMEINFKRRQAWQKRRAKDVIIARW